MQLFGLRFNLTTLLFISLVTYPGSLWGAELKAEDLVTKHLDSIGSAQIRNSLKSRVVQGAATYRVLVGGSGAIDGKCILATDGPKSNLLLKINASGYRGEQWIWNGSKISIAGTYDDKSRSEFGDFVLGQDIALRENLLGGVWSSGWPLLDLEHHRAKVHGAGTKKVDGRELLVLRYQPKRGTDLNIALYFDPITYQHVMTTYSVAPSSGMGEGEIATARKQATRYLIEEKFADFQSLDGLTLPSHYSLRFTEELDNGFTKSVEWQVRAVNILNNQSIDPRSFEVK